MTNEEMKALCDSLNSEEDAYELMKKNGYTGTMEEFLALCAKAADDMSMDMDDMDQVAGGFGWEDVKGYAGIAVDKTVDALSKTWDWAQKNPEAAAGIVGGTLVAVAGITYVAKRRGSASTVPQPVPGNVAPQNVFTRVDVDGENLASESGRSSNASSSSSGSINLLDFT